MRSKEIRKVCFVGAGTMGAANSLIAAASGYEVTVYDSSPAALKTLPARYQAATDFLLAHPAFNKWPVEGAAARVTLTTDPFLAARDADLLSESVSERLEVKRSVHRQFDALCPPHAIMTTNSSTLAVSAIETAVQRGERFAALHYHLCSRLVDIMKGTRTSEETIAVLRQYVLRCNTIPMVLRKEKAGYLYNSFLTSLLWAAIMLVAEGQGSPADVDRAWMAGMQPWTGPGPFGIIDSIGIDVVYDATRQSKDISRETSAQMVAFLKPYVDRNELGMKSGRGFYGYPNPAYEEAGFVGAVPGDERLCRNLVTHMVVTALMLVIDGYADACEIDRAWLVAQEFHHADIGPFGLLDQRGLDRFLGDLDEISGIVGDDQKGKIADFLKPYIQRGALGMQAGKGFYTYPDPVYRKPGFLFEQP